MRYHATAAGNVAFTPEEELEANAADAAFLAGSATREAEKTRATAKTARETSVAALTVTTTSGKVFNGCEVSLGRMNNAITIAGIAGLTETQWTLADNSRVTVTLDEMKEAMKLAGLAQSQLWSLS